MRLSSWVKTEEDFRWRGTEVTRIESFSDAVFAFSVTLLVVSLEVPRSYDELINAMLGFPVFGTCFGILVSFWHSHVRYFRRYGVQSAYVTMLNSALLFCLLFYIYPLKFLFTGLFGSHSAGEGALEITEVQARVLLVIYGLGYTATSTVFVLLYQHAWQGRDVLQLNAMERYLTRLNLLDHFILAMVGVGSIALALMLPGRLVGIAGFFYFAIPLYYWVARPRFIARMRPLL